MYAQEAKFRKQAMWSEKTFNKMAKLPISCSYLLPLSQMETRLFEVDNSHHAVRGKDVKGVGVRPDDG